MKTKPHVVLLTCLFSVLALVFVSCSTTKKPKADWANRVGYYTFEQAVEELGPPDKQATLADGTVVADWIRRQSSGSGLGIGIGGGSYGHSGGMGVGVGQSFGTPDQILRLTFGPDKKLTAWSKNY